MYILINRDVSVELSESDKGFKRFKKQICKFGEYVNPNGVGKMVLEKSFLLLSFAILYDFLKNT